MTRVCLVCIKDFKTFTMSLSTETTFTPTTSAITDTTEFTSTQKSETKEPTTKQTNSLTDFDIGSNTLVPDPSKFTTDSTSFNIKNLNNPTSNFHFTTTQFANTERNPTCDLSTEDLWQTVLLPFVLILQV